MSKSWTRATCRGPKAGRARRRVAKVAVSAVTTEVWNEAICLPSSQRVAVTFQRRNAARQGGSGSCFAPVGAAMPTKNLYMFLPVLHG